VRAFAEGESLRRIAEAEEPAQLRLRCAVPHESLACAGLTVYGAECGRFPVCPTIVLEW
jgi:hypothetical protein